MTWFLPREPMKFTFPGPVGLNQKAQCCASPAFRRAWGRGGLEGWLRRAQTQGSRGRGEKLHLSRRRADVPHLEAECNFGLTFSEQQTLLLLKKGKTGLGYFVMSRLFVNSWCLCLHLRFWRNCDTVRACF